MGPLSHCRQSPVSWWKNLSKGGVLLFSVVIPLYNKGETIVDTLQSVLAQDFPHFEVVIVDDGSTDDGPQKIERYFDDPRIRTVRQKNAGEGAARNSGIQAARFNWIAPLDADDAWLPEYLSQVNNAIQRFPKTGMVCCGGVGRYPDGSGFVRQSKHGRTAPQRVDFFEAPFFFGNASSIVFSKELALRVGGFPIGMAHQADVVFFFSLALLTEVVFCPAPLSVYNLGLPGQVSSDRRTNIAGALESANKIYRFWASLDPEQRDPHCINSLVENIRSGVRFALVSSDHELVD